MRADVWITAGMLLLTLSMRPAFADEASTSTSPETERRQQPRRYDGKTAEEWQTVIKSLELTSPEAAAAVPGLIALCRDASLPEETRFQAAYTLGRIGAGAEPAVPVLRDLLQTAVERDPSTARWVAKALALFGPRAAPATTELATLATADDQPLAVRLAATEALGRIGGAHPASIPTLVALAESSPGEPSVVSEQLQAAAVDSLAIVGSPAAAAVPLLIRLTRDEAGDLRQRAAAALGAMGFSAGIAAAALVDLVLFDELPEVRDAAATALGAIGESGESALRQLLSDEDVTVRRRAAVALGRIEKLSDASRQTLRTALADSDVNVRLNSVESLRKAGQGSEALIPILLSGLTEPERLPRMQAYRLLIDMREAADEIVPRLEKLTEDERPYVRQVARKAIEELTQPQTVD